MQDKWAAGRPRVPMCVTADMSLLASEADGQEVKFRKVLSLLCRLIHGLWERRKKRNGL